MNEPYKYEAAMAEVYALAADINYTSAVNNGLVQETSELL